ncbi:MAG TPA: bifunctional acetate--CoA ligase family protein/GNAT family N-acetyltransferase [Hyphomicrobiaceae bacterium]|nr:bifunctional acetate--CoA ligase family protein/GNAT family N-acetyltransferase [Hyphomicrobiaceae bacterium]
MTVRNLEFLLSPRSVVLVGASTRPGSVGLITARNLVSGGFSGPVWLVNPKYRSIEGHDCYSSVGALPAAPDLAVIVTPPQTVPQLIQELGAKGTRAAVVITAGVRDDLKGAMLEASQPYLLRVQGPNCLGLMLPRIGLNASFSHCPPLSGDLAFVSQSGALITAIVDWARGRSIGFSHVVSLGDMADVDFGDLLDYLAGDVQSRAILLYMESVTHAPKFMSAARRAARSKPVIVVKAGRSASGAKAALSHTGALAGTDAAYEAAFRRAGLLRVRELADLFSAAEILARHPQLTGERLAILTNGGGAGVLAADRLGDLAGTLGRISDGTRAALDAVLPATWSHGNPIDIIGDADAARYGQALELLLERDDADAVLVMNCPTALASSTEVAERIATVVDRHKASTARPKAVITAWLGDEASRDARRLFAQKGIGSFATPSEAIDGFMQLVRYARAQEELMRTPPSLPAELDVDTGKAAGTLQSVLANGRATLSEIEAKELLAAYGIPVVPTAHARDPAEVGKLAAGLIERHGACVVKVLSDDISHKSDVGGVRLGLERAGDAQQAAADMLQRIARALPDAKIKGFTVQPMIRRPRAHELILGMSVDQAFGPLLMFGAGGTAVEVIRDTAHALPPLDLKLARDLMRQTRIWHLLQGYRDRPAANIEAIAEALVRLSYLVAHHPQVREIDINPLLADEQGVIALDARVRVADAASEPRVAMAVRPYPAEWATETEVAGLGPVQLRPIRPEDEGLYRDFFARVSLDDQRLRFFTAAPNLSHRFLAQLTQIDYAREMAFVAIAKSDGALLGVARMIADPDYTRAEYAVLVRSDLKGCGLGWRLMQHLIAYAKAEKLEQLHGAVLADNTSMLQMCRELGFAVDVEPGDTSVRRVRLRLVEG